MTYAGTWHLRGARKYEQDRFHECYEEFGTDREAAEAYGVTKETFGAWRRMLGLKAKRNHQWGFAGAHARLGDGEVARRMAVYGLGRRVTVKAAASMLGLTANAYKQWMRNYDLTQHHARADRLSVAEVRRRMRVWRESETDSEAARRLGMAQSDFHHWRVKRGLPRKCPPGHHITTASEKTSQLPSTTGT